MERALAIFDQSHWDTSFFAAMALCYLGMVRLGKGTVHEAEALAREALPRFQQRQSRPGMRLCMRLMADVKASRGDAVGAARLLAASETIRRTLGESLSRKEQEQAARLCERFLSELGPAASVREQGIGSAWTEEEAVAFAMGQASAPKWRPATAAVPSVRMDLAGVPRDARLMAFRSGPLHGRERVASMARARVDEGGTVRWSEQCFCATPLQHARETVYDRYFTGLHTEAAEDYGETEGKPFMEILARPASR